MNSLASIVILLQAALSLLSGAQQTNNPALVAQANVFAQTAVTMAGQVLEQQTSPIYEPTVGGGTVNEQGQSVIIPPDTTPSLPVVPQQLGGVSNPTYSPWNIEPKWQFNISTSTYSDSRTNKIVSFWIETHGTDRNEVDFDGQTKSLSLPNGYSKIEFQDISPGSYDYVIRAYKGDKVGVATGTIDVQ